MISIYSGSNNLSKCVLLKQKWVSPDKLESLAV